MHQNVKFLLNPVDIQSKQSIVLCNEPEPMSKKIDKLRGGGGGYSGYFIIISAILGFVCLIPAIALTFTGAAALGNGPDNGRLVSGIILFAFSITLLILSVLTCCLR